MKISCNATNSSSLQTVGLKVSQDGYIRMSLSNLMALPLNHFLSGLDDSLTQHAAEDGTRASICGYTEWLSASTPAVTVGWDWCLDLTGASPRYVRAGCPRSNVMLIDEGNGQDLGDNATSVMMMAKIDQSGWENDVQKHIAMRYA